MKKYRNNHREGHAAPGQRQGSQRSWLISPAWLYALTAFDLLEDERRRSLERTDKLASDEG